MSNEELALVDEYFELMNLSKSQYLLEEGEVCNFIAFVNRGCIRHFHIKDGLEITCDISFENKFITDFKSFNLGSKTNISFRALENSELLLIQKESLSELYERSTTFAEIGRRIAENVAMRTTEIAMSLASDKPEKRYRKLLMTNPEIFQRVPQKHIANLLGLTPESLSRIRRRHYQASKA